MRGKTTCLTLLQAQQFMACSKLASFHSPGGTGTWIGRVPQSGRHPFTTNPVKTSLQLQ